LVWGDCCTFCRQTEAVRKLSPARLRGSLCHHSVTLLHIFLNTENLPVSIRYMGVCIAHVELGVPFPAQMNMFVPFTFCSLLDSSSLTTSSDGCSPSDSTLVIY
jgi:hypothetical protein